MDDLWLTVRKWLIRILIPLLFALGAGAGWNLRAAQDHRIPSSNH